ncbi:unnamed protein product [Chrysodeixis includens]|uniref:Sperm microtubule inner protein 1 C-terminal domain-containing protein n=1 Tax=Chrysodeixis includens TaxID=689277 RepID=A0A9N8Q0L4_CHRIL|nr:unnamed protein product [Chrysodeixis includens]
MPAIDITNPDVIKFLTENYEKTTHLRMRWNQVHGQKLKKAATLNREEKGYFEKDVLEKCVNLGMATITRDHFTGAGNKRKKPIRDGLHIPGIADLRKGHSIIDVGLGDAKEDPRLAQPDTDLRRGPVMRPINPKEEALIYKGIPHFGRRVYMKSRLRMAPEEKYYFRETTGWECGWRLRDSYFAGHGPAHGRVWHLTRGSLSRSGPQPDPDYYKELEKRGATKCTNA